MNTVHSNVPVAELLRPVDSLPPEASLQIAAATMHRFGVTAVPVMSNMGALSIITESDLLEALKSGLRSSSPISKIAWRRPEVVSASHSSEYAQDKLIKSGESILIVLDEIGQALGILSSSDILCEVTKEIRPKMIGGMATPYGVYLTNGAINAGPLGYALISVGAIIFSGFIIASLVAFFIAEGAFKPLFGNTFAMNSIPSLSILIFLVGMRLSPLSGIHGAEHKVVHAIERNEQLIPEIVMRMPRVHPRCGTNLAVAISLFLGISQSAWFSDPQITLLLAIFLTLFWWRPLGSLVQFFFTTKEPNEKQLANGIATGKELLEKYKRVPILYPTLPMRIWSSGLPQILIGSFSAYFVLDRIISWLNLPKFY